MSKRHFAAIAAALAAERQRQQDALSAIGISVVDLVAIRIAAILGTFNPAFDRERFLRACRGEA